MVIKKVDGKEDFFTIVRRVARKSDLREDLTIQSQGIDWLDLMEVIGRLEIEWGGLVRRL